MNIVILQIPVRVTMLSGKDVTMSHDLVRHLLEGFSLEMTGKDIAALRSARDVIPAGTKINVTFLGSEGVAQRVSAAREIRNLGFVPVPHISARRLGGSSELEGFLEQLREVDATSNLFCVAGDPVTPAGAYSDSLSLIQTGLLRQFGASEVGIAGYPEGHPKIADEVLWTHLSDKISALEKQKIRPVILTQFSFNAEATYRWVREVRDRGIGAELRIGTPGPAGMKRLLSYARRFGVASSAGIVKRYGFSLANLTATAGPGKFLNEFGKKLGTFPNRGVVKTHFYTFGGLEATATWGTRFVADTQTHV